MAASSSSFQSDVENLAPVNLPANASVAEGLSAFLLKLGDCTDPTVQDVIQHIHMFKTCGIVAARHPLQL